jgi:hypothetical protein
MTRGLTAAIIFVALTTAAAAQRGASTSEPPAEIPPHLIYLSMDVGDQLNTHEG